MQYVKRLSFAAICIAVAMCAWAEGIWYAPAQSATEAQTFVDNDEIKIASVYDANGKAQGRTICGIQFDGYLQLRVAAAPTADVPTGTQQSGSTSLVIEPKANADITVYYRMQSKAENDDGTYVFEPGSSKDIQCCNQVDFAPLKGEIQWDETFSDTEKYNYCCTTFHLTDGLAYTLYARGTTMQLFGIVYKANNAIGPTTDAIPAFPGAEGYARYTTTGGRGGEIRHVTNLNDDGVGSFRAAVTGNAKKIVVFDISGEINLSSEVKIGSNTTILGQTAPGEGVTLRMQTVNCYGDNIIIRFLRIRRGNIDLTAGDKDGADATWRRHSSNIILDHCSFSWADDEIASFYDNNNFTMQWCTIGEPFNHNNHAFGGIWGGKGASFHHNLMIHCNNRVPRFNGSRYTWDGYDHTEFETTVLAERVDFRNMVLYNWGTGKCYGGGGGGFINIVNCYYKAGPATANTKIVTQCDKENDLFSKYFIEGNYVTAAGDEAQNYDWKGVKTSEGVLPAWEQTFTDPLDLYRQGANAMHTVKLEAPVDIESTTTHSAEVAFEKVLLYAGASLMRDMVDERYAIEAAQGTARQYDGSSYPGILRTEDDLDTYSIRTEGQSRPDGWDSDGDGMPDAWEIANGLNPDNASDANSYTLCSKGYYTNIEVYANSLVENIVKNQNADAQTSVEEYYPEVVATSSVSSELITDKMILHTEVYSIDGIKRSVPNKGINMRRILYDDGTVKVEKYVQSDSISQ